MSNVHALHAELPEASVEYAPLVEPGEYKLAFVHFTTALMFGRAPKLGLLFRVLDFGPSNGVVLPRWYGVKRLKGRPGKNGNFVAKARGDFIEDFYRLLDHKGRLDRLPMSQWRQGVYTGVVETVTKNSRGREYPEPVRYSVIRSLKERNNG